MRRLDSALLSDSQPFSVLCSGSVLVRAWRATRIRGTTPRPCRGCRVSSAFARIDALAQLALRVNRPDQPVLGLPGGAAICSVRCKLRKEINCTANSRSEEDNPQPYRFLTVSYGVYREENLQTEYQDSNQWRRTVLVRNVGRAAATRRVTAPRAETVIDTATDSQSRSDNLTRGISIGQ